MIAIELIDLLPGPASRTWLDVWLTFYQAVRKIEDSSNHITDGLKNIENHEFLRLF